MAYAAISDVAKILQPEEVPEDATDNLTTVLEEASDLVIGYLGYVFDQPDEDDDGVPDDVPPAVRRVVARVALRAFTDEPDEAGATSSRDLMGPFSHDVNWSKEAQDRSVYLSEGEKLRLEPYIRGYEAGAAHYPMYDYTDPCPFYLTRSGGRHVGY